MPRLHLLHLLAASLLLVNTATAQIHNVAAAAGDVIRTRLADLRPTQGAIGYDQIFATLARWNPDYHQTGPATPDSLRQSLGHKFNSYCSDTGQGKLDAEFLTHPEKLQQARLDAPETFSCTAPPGHHAGALKTVVIGPDNALYLTDGHHSFSALYEARDGGADLPVWVRVDQNRSHLPTMTDFWQKMQAEQKAWLKDGNNHTLRPADLTLNLGLISAENPNGLQNDPYRALVYFTRNIGYSNKNMVEFGEFRWAQWLRKHLDLAHYTTTGKSPQTILAASTLNPATLEKTGSSTSYAAAVRDAALLMAGAAPTEPVSVGHTAASLGQIRLLPDAPAGSATDRALHRLEALTYIAAAPDTVSPRPPGSLWLAVMYRISHP